MRTLRAFLLRFGNVFHRGRREADLAEEMASTLQMHIDENVRAGMSPDEARHAALRSFGGVDQTKEQCRDARTLPFLESIVQDLRFALRQLRKSPAFTTVAVLTLALGIGANTAIYSLLDTVFGRPLPIPNPEELVYLYHSGPVQGITNQDELGNKDRPSFSYPMFRELQAAQTAFIGLAGSQGQGVSLSYNGQASAGTAELVSGNYFNVLALRPALGRLFTEDDDRVPGGHPVAVLAYAYWSSRFGRDTSVLNQSVVVNGYPMTIVGVAQRDFTSESLTRKPDVFVPISMKKEITADWGDGLRDRKYYWVALLGRLKPGVSLDQAHAGSNVAYRSLLEQDIPLLELSQEEPDYLSRFRAKQIVLKPGPQPRGGLPEEVRQLLPLAMLLPGLVVLVCCANIANLQLARSAVRKREMAMRRTVGASRGRLIRQLFTESSTLALAGGVLGIAVAHWTLKGIVSTFPTSGTLATIVTPYLTADLNWRVLLFTAALSVFVGILFGIFPALQTTSPNLLSFLKDATTQATAGRAAKYVQNALVSVQISVSLLLLMTAAVFGLTLANLTRVELGIESNHLLTFLVNPKQNQYDDPRALQFYEELTERLRALPGVTLVSAAQVPAIAMSNRGMSISVEGYSAPDASSLESNANVVGPEYFRTMGIPLLVGREFTSLDHQSSTMVAIVNEAFADRFLANQNAVGRRMATSGLPNTVPDMQIVGVVKNAKYSSVRAAVPPVFYTPYKQVSGRQRGLYFYLRTATEPEQLVALVQREVAALDPNLPIRDLKTMETQISETLFHERLLAQLTGMFAGLALLLAVVGLYGVLSYNVARRKHEIGIRMALGAEPGGIVRMVVWQGMKLALIGVVIGLGAALALTRLIRNLLYGVSPTDPFTYVAVSIVLIGVAALASYIPARRAARVDPMQALRAE